VCHQKVVLPVRKDDTWSACPFSSIGVPLQGKIDNPTLQTASNWEPPVEYIDLPLNCHYGNSNWHHSGAEATS
jgi:hypothetical protein